jgi:hypothetical protein
MGKALQLTVASNSRMALFRWLRQLVRSSLESLWLLPGIEFPSGFEGILKKFTEEF